MEGNNKPRVLLINCYQADHDRLIADYTHWLKLLFDIRQVHLDKLSSTKVDADAIVISGSERSLKNESLPGTLKEICLESTKPLLGIGYGHEALASAWGTKILTREKIEGEQTIKTLDPKGVIHNLGLFFMAFESHTEQVAKNRKLTKHFDILAASADCPVEVIQHRKRPLWGVQFHPEKSFPEGRQVAENLARIIRKGKP